MVLRLKQPSESLVCLLKQSAGSRSLDIGGLGWGPRICNFNKSQVMLVLLMQGPHFENKLLRVIQGLPLCLMAQRLTL